MIDALNILREKLLAIDGIDAGFANVQMVDKVAMVIDKDGQQYNGISDTNGNMFYLRSTRKTSFALLDGKCSKRYKTTAPCEAVFVFQKLDTEKLLNRIVPMISKAGRIISVDANSDSLYIKETGNKNPKMDFNQWQILKIEFQIIDVVTSMTKCIENLCEC